MENGPVVATMLFTYYEHGTNNLEEWGWTHSSPDDYYPYPGPVESANHQVVLVGWKDDPDIGNGGYWIVKNSCSSEWGYNGFFNIEYGSLNIDSIEIDWVEYNPDLYNNWAPKVYSGGMYSGSVGEEINFDGTSTIDPEDDIVEYLWDFGEGTQKNGVTQTHTYNENGIYPVILTVVDNNGNIGIDETWVFIDRSNSPPDTPVLRGRRIGQSEKEFEYTFYADDPDGDDVSFFVQWDGRDSSGWTEYVPSGTSIELRHRFYLSGLKDTVIKVKAKDEHGAWSDWARYRVNFGFSRNIVTNSMLFQFLERYPLLNLFLQRL